MKNLNAMIFLGTLLLIIGGCSKDRQVTEKQKEQPVNTKSSIATGAQITFVELGSVNCIPCRMMQPVMKEIETAYAGRVKVVFIDVLTDQGRPYMQQFGIKAIPTQVFLDAQGKELSRHTGFFPKDSIVALLSNNGVK
jgi:thioredoxin 1